ncbi:MAG: hypothetical protein IJN75_04765 [Clostridia bacterium]|nr:hypothetical protein [Clostridia bacterium]
MKEFFRKQMMNADKEFRPVQIVHTFLPNTKEEREAYFKNAEAMGLGGFVINVGGDKDNYPFDEAEWALFKEKAEDVVAHNFRLWLYDELGFPSGAAGKSVLERDRSRRVKAMLCRSERCVDGHAELMARGNELMAGAFPIIAETVIPENEKQYTLSENGIAPKREADKLIFDVPTDKEYLAVYIYTDQIEYYTMHDVHFVDIMDDQVTDHFIEHTHENYLKHLGCELMSKVEAIFTDEPSISVHGASGKFYESDQLIGWSPSLGVPERPLGLFFATDGDYRSVRRDYWTKLSDRLAKNYFEKISSYCDKVGMLSTGHLYGEENLAMQIGLNGSLFRMEDKMTFPGVDRLYCTDPVNIIPEKTAVGAAHLNGRAHIMSESSSHFEDCWWNSSYDVTDMINSTLYQYVMGLDSTASYHSYQPIPEERLWTDVVGAASAMISIGKHCCPLLVCIPQRKGYERYVPSSSKYWDGVLTWEVEFKMNEEQTRLGLAYAHALKHMLNDGFDFDLIDEEALPRIAVEGGILKSEHESFQAIVVFDDGRELEDEVKVLLKHGAKVIAVRFENEDAPKIDGVIYTTVDTLTSSLSQEVVRPIELKYEGGTVWYNCHEYDGGRVFLIHNFSKEDSFISFELSGELELFRIFEKTSEKAECGKKYLLKGKEAVVLFAE